MQAAGWSGRRVPPGAPAAARMKYPAPCAEQKFGDDSAVAVLAARVLQREAAMAYRQLIGDVALIATIGFLAAVIVGAL
jgi:hypothetical protein